MKPMTPSRFDRIVFVAANIILLIVALVLASMLMSSCTTFDKAVRKYASNKIDTTFVTVSQTVPRDSAVLRIVTDTTTLTREVRQGRARIIYQRDGHTTLIKADCDSVVIEKKVPQYIYKQVWGIDPKYKNQAESWRLATIVLACLLGAAVLVYLFLYHLKINIAKR